MRPSFATRLNLDLLEENYERWQNDPESVDSSWSAFFEGFELGDLHLRNGAATAAQPGPETGESPLQTRIDGLVYAYRTLGHTIARLDPLAKKRPENPLLSLRELGFSEKDLDMQVSSKFFLGQSQDDAARNDRGARRHLCGHDRRRVSAHSESAHSQLGPASARIASGQARDLAGSADRDPAHPPGSRDVRNFPAHALRRAKAFLAPGRGIAHGHSRHDSAALPGRRGSRKFAWAWRIAAGSMSWRIS